MTAFTTSNIPADISSLEELAAWTMYALRECAPSQAILEAPNTVNFQCDVLERVNPNGDQLFVGRIVLKMSPLSSVTGKRWNAIQQIPQSASLPSYYTSI